ncbi:MAG: pyridoxal phosphate-dependent aminotransferase [Caulobacteraceae bacterium]
MNNITENRSINSAYMRFAKLDTAARFNLASSGVADCALADIAPDAADLVLHGDNVYGWPPLAQAIADRFGVDPACVVIPGGGCSFANHLAMAAILAPGEEALIEAPTYELLVATLSYLGATIRTFPRTFETAWRLDPEIVARELSPATRLVVITNLHNPSSARAAEAEIRAIADAAPGALVMVDEVYLELTFADGAARTAFREDGNIVVTSSLTKAYGLSGLRCGWILAPAPLAERMRGLNDLFAAKPAHIAERLALVALGRLDELRERALALTDANRAAYREILGAHPALEQVPPEAGTIVFPKLKRGDAEGFFRLLKTRFETSVVPGHFFGAPEHIRIGLGGDPAMTREGLARLAEALTLWEESSSPSGRGRDAP